MKILLLSLLTLVSPFAAHANEAPVLMCDRHAIRQAIQLSQLEVHQSNYQIESRQGIKEKSLRPDLLAIEGNVYGKKVFNLSYDVIPDASISAHNIAIYADTIKDLNSLVPDSDKNSSDAHMFIMAHEMGHMVQAQWQKHHSSGPSPMGLSDNQGNSTGGFNLLHAETDCIAVELMRMAGQKDFSTVI